MKAAVRHDIQGLRALAVLAVVVFHINAGWLPGGYIGVDVFFVISGFLINGILLRHKDEGSFRFGSFYASRIARIVPAYVAMLLFTSLAAAVLLLPQDFAYFWNSLKRAALFASNVHFAAAGDYFSPNAHEWPVLHTWSLAVEMQFYLLLPLLVVLLPRRYLLPAMALLTIVLTVTAQHWLTRSGHGAAIYYSLLARVPEFLIGAIAAGLKPPADELRLRWQAGLAPCALTILLICLVMMDGKVLFPGVNALIPGVATAVLLWSRQGPVQQWLSARVAVWIGERSYSLYLWHWPILTFLRYYTGELVLDAPLVALYGVVVMLAAYASHRWIETPLRLRPYPQKAFWKAYVVAAAALVTTAGSKQINVHIVAPPSAEITRYAQPDKICHGKVLRTCTRGVSTAPTPLLLIGDSHAAQLNLFADEVGLSQDIAIVMISASSCVPIPGFDIERIAEYARAECSTQILEASIAATRASTILIAGKWTFHTDSERFMQAMDKYLSEQMDHGKRVIVLAQVPPLLSDPLRVQRWASLGLPVSAVRIDPKGQVANKRMQALVAKHHNAMFWDITSDGFIESVLHERGMVIYSDRHHLNEIGSHILGRHVANGFRELLLLRPLHTTTSLRD